MALRYTLAKNLDEFVHDHLQSDEAFIQDVKKAIKLLNGFLQERCFFPGTPFPVRVSKVVKGPFSGKGTTLKDQYNADLVIFLANLRSFQDQILRREEFIREIRQDLKVFRRCTKTDIFELKIKAQDPSNPWVLSFLLSSPWFIGATVEFNVLLAFDVLGQVTKPYRPDPKIYIKLIEECTSQQTEGEFSNCFIELQKDFVKRRPTKVKRLIRLVKRWYQLCKEKLGSPLPPQYALELLAIYAWENGSRRPHFNMAQGFKTVLELIMGYQQLSIYWTEYYDFENPKIRDYLISQLMKPRYPHPWLSPTHKGANSDRVSTRRMEGAHALHLLSISCCLSLHWAPDSCHLVGTTASGTRGWTSAHPLTEGETEVLSLSELDQKTVRSLSR